MTVVSSFAVIMATYSKGYSIFKIYYTTNYKIKPVTPSHSFLALGEKHAQRF